MRIMKVSFLGNFLIGTPNEFNVAGMNETPAKTLFGCNYERLVELKQVYDPHNVFGRCFNLMPGHGRDVPQN